MRSSWTEGRVRWQVSTLTVSSGAVISVDFSPDGKSVVTGSDDDLVKIWNAEPGAEVSSSVRARSGWRGAGIAFLGIRVCNVVEVV